MATTSDFLNTVVASPEPEESEDSITHGGSYIEPDNSEQRDSDNELLDTDTLYSDLLRYPVENGRRYHKYREGTYIFPNDDSESERLNLQHFLLEKLFGGRAHFAPLQDPKKILDIGTGTGIWVLDMSEIYPDAEIEGTDLSPIQSTYVPPNVRFVIDDANEEDWLHPPETFDFIHTRMMIGCFNDFAGIIRKSYKYLKPGGWLESQEIYPILYSDVRPLPADFPLVEWNERTHEASMTYGTPFRTANKLKMWYERAGFVDVHEEILKVPMNPWPADTHYKEIGRMSEYNLHLGVQGFTLALFSRVYGWTKNEIEVYLVNVRKSISDRSVCAYHRCYVVWGRKPGVGESVAQEGSPSRSQHPPPSSSSLSARAQAGAEVSGTSSEDKDGRGRVYDHQANAAAQLAYRDPLPPSPSSDHPQHSSSATQTQTQHQQGGKRKSTASPEMVELDVAARGDVALPPGIGEVGRRE